jgi:hypothetical protein
MTATPDRRFLGDLLATAIPIEKDELLAEIPRALEPRLSVVREELGACDILLSRLEKMLAA